MTNTNHSLPKGTSDEHYTPKVLFDLLDIKFDLDVAAPIGGSGIASNWFDKETDGLIQSWYGNVWMNPPYSNPTPWVRKFIEHDQGIALLPITRGKWWDALWEKADAIVPLTYNFKFDRPDNLPSKPIVFRTALYAFGSGNAKALHNINAKVR